MSEPATVSVIITSHNRHDALRRAIGSVEAQTRPAHEIVVVDDGSSPPVDVDDAVVLVRHDTPRGVCAARNTGVAAATGRYVLFLDDDDTLAPEALADSLEALAGSRLPAPVAALGIMAVVDEHGRELDRRRPPTFRRGSSWLFDQKDPQRSLQVQNSLLVPRDVVVGIGGWDELLGAWVHDDFFLRLTRVCSLQPCDRVTYRMLQPTGARDHVSRRLSVRAAAMERTLHKHPDAFARHPRKHAKYLGTIAMTWLRVGEHRRALRTAWRALRVDPRRPKAVEQLTIALAGPRVYAALDRGRDLPRR